MIAENGGRDLLGSTELLYLPRRLGTRGLMSIEIEFEYKLTKIKAAVRLHSNVDPTMGVMCQFEERAERKSKEWKRKG